MQFFFTHGVYVLQSGVEPMPNAVEVIFSQLPIAVVLTDLNIDLLVQQQT